MNFRFSTRAAGNLVLLLTAFIWGSAFVAQRAGMDHLGPFAFNGLRQFVACACLAPLLWLLRRRDAAAGRPPAAKGTLAVAAISCGLALFVAASTQQIGLLQASSAHGGFITSLYILLVPLLSIFLGRRVHPLHLFCVAMGIAGLYFLCAMDGLASIGGGDWWLLACAFAFSGHILLVGRYARQVDPVALSLLQFLVVGLLSLPFIPVEHHWFACEPFTFGALRAAAVPFLYAAVGSSAIGYTLQIVGQRHTDATVASLIMCMEAVFAVLVGWAFGESLAPAEWLGCALLFAAILLAQLPVGRPAAP